MKRTEIGSWAVTTWCALFLLTACGGAEPDPVPEAAQPQPAAEAAPPQRRRVRRLPPRPPKIPCRFRTSLPPRC